MTYIWLGFAGGIVAFSHCLGMCGGFALHFSQGHNRRTMLGCQLLWHAGKTSTYIFLGATAGFFGSRIGLMDQFPRLQNLFTYAAGGIMFLMGVILIGLIPIKSKFGPREKNDGILTAVFRQLLGQPTLSSAFVLGLATGFLPCPIVLGFLILAMQAGSVINGMSIMGALGAGTIWALLLLGMTGHMIRLPLRRWSPAIGGAILILLGAVTVLRGTESFHRLFGCPHTGTKTTASPPCCCEKTKPL
jgi:uncharacterized protein